VSRAFVILLHTDHGPDHYDLMVECGESLSTWRVGRNPLELNAGDSCPAVRLADHRKAYLAYEGPVSRGQGEVRRVERGTCELVEEHEARQQLRLTGHAFDGAFELRPVHGDEWELRRLG
jgi:hypothetical protein